MIANMILITTIIIFYHSSALNSANIVPRAALMPPWAATVCDRVGNSFVTHAVLNLWMMIMIVIVDSDDSIDDDDDDDDTNDDDDDGDNNAADD